MMVVPAPRAICPLSFSEFRPKTVRVESSAANTKPATANAPTITGREDLNCPGMGVLLLLSGGGGTVRLPTSGVHRLEALRLAILILTKDVEQRAVPVQRNWSPDGRRAVEIVHVALGRGNSLEDRRRRCWPGHKIRTSVQMAAHNQDPFAAVGVSD